MRSHRGARAEASGSPAWTIEGEGGTGGCSPTKGGCGDGTTNTRWRYGRQRRERARTRAPGAPRRSAASSSAQTPHELGCSPDLPLVRGRAARALVFGSIGRGLRRTAPRRYLERRPASPEDALLVVPANSDPGKPMGGSAHPHRLDDPVTLSPVSAAQSDEPVPSGRPCLGRTREERRNELGLLSRGRVDGHLHGGVRQGC
jgi:hypothetical protein